MDEIEAWAREFYEIDESAMGEFERNVIEEQVWREWRSDAVKDWAEAEDSVIHLWEQINRTLTLLSPDSRYAEFIGEYAGDRYIGLYNSAKRQIFIRGDIGDFDLVAELTYLHEYAHHLQNEKYDFVFWRKCFRGDGDANGAITALIEGDASNTEYEYIENVIGWERLEDYYDSVEDRGAGALDEPVMARYQDEVNSFTYSMGSLFVWATGEYLHKFSECSNCETVRQRIDEAFKRPPFTTEQVYDVLKYFDNERRYTIDLPKDFMGADWELRHSSTIGKSDWVVLLAALTGEEDDEFHAQFPEWDGDYGMLLEDKNGKALYVQVVRWRGDEYINRLVDVFDAESRLTRRWTVPLSDDVAFADYYVWGGDTGSIALAVESVPGWHYTMFLAVGPDIESAEKAVFAARDDVTLDGDLMFPPAAATPSN